MGKKRNKTKKFSKETQTALKAALREDLKSGDVTSRLLIPAKSRGKARIIAKEPGVFCGAPAVKKLAALADKNLKIKIQIGEGASFKKNRVLIRLEGRIQSILKVERTLLNLLGHLCGISTRTREFSDKVKKYSVQVFDTRKTMPLLREMEKYAVSTGGGSNHRMGLYDCVFVKENHRRFGDLSKLRKLRGQYEIEARNLKEVKEALPWNPQVILLDNFTPAQLSRAVKYVRAKNKKVILEASGGINHKNLLSIARSGVNRVSIGSLTHSVKSIDLSLLVD